MTGARRTVPVRRASEGDERHVVGARGPGGHRDHGCAATDVTSRTRPPPSGQSGDTVAQHGPGVRLRPLAIGDVLDETFRVYRRHFLSFVVAMAVVVVPMTLLGTALSLAFGLQPGVPGAFGTGLDRPGGPSVEQIAAFVVVMLILVVVGGVGYLLSTIATVQLATNAILGREVDVREAYREAARRSGAVVVSGILSGLAVGLLVLTCLGIPFAVYLGLGWSVAIPAIVAERLGGVDGLRRSWRLVHGHRWRLLFVFLLMGLISWLLVSLPGGLASFLTVPVVLLADNNPAAVAGANVFNSLVGAVGQSLFGGLGLITATLVYYDLLIRQEAFDLQQRVETLDAPGDHYATGSPASPDDHRPDYPAPPTERSRPPSGPPPPPIEER